MMHHHDSAAELFRELFCEVFCRCHRPKTRAVVRLTLGSNAITFTGDFTMDVPDSGGPFTADIVNFVDSKGNPTTDADVPVWATDHTDIVTVAVSPTNPQEATLTLTGSLGQAQVTATFGDPTAGGFVVTGSLNVLPGAAVSATMTIT
jgi:hypothetical protein